MIPLMVLLSRAGRPLALAILGVSGTVALSAYGAALRALVRLVLG